MLLTGLIGYFWAHFTSFYDIILPLSQQNVISLVPGEADTFFAKSCPFQNHRNPIMVPYLLHPLNRIPMDSTFAGAMRRSVPLALCHVYMPSVAARRSSGCLVLLLAMETDRRLLKNMEKNSFHQAQKSQIKIYQATGVEKTIGAYWNQIMSFQ